MSNSSEDWLRVVYGGGLDPKPDRGSKPRPAIAVRHSPSALLPPGDLREQRVRVTVIPAEAGTSWDLYLTCSGGTGPTGCRIWWKVEPGTWQPLTDVRHRLAEGRGRLRLDVSIRIEVDEDSAASADLPRLRLVGERR